VALAAAPARAGLPRHLRDQPGHGSHGRLPAGGRGDGEVHRDREHVPFPVLLACFPQLGATAIHLVAGHPRKRDAGAGRAGDHRGAQRGLGDELHVIRDARPLPPLPVRTPGLRQVEPEIEQGVRAGADGSVKLTV